MYTALTKNDIKACRFSLWYSLLETFSEESHINRRALCYFKNMTDSFNSGSSAMHLPVRGRNAEERNLTRTKSFCLYSIKTKHGWTPQPVTFCLLGSWNSSMNLINLTGFSQLLCCVQMYKSLYCKLFWIKTSANWMSWIFVNPLCVCQWTLLLHGVCWNWFGLQWTKGSRLAWLPLSHGEGERERVYDLKPSLHPSFNIHPSILNGIL